MRCQVSGVRFQVSGFGCQGNEVVNPGSSYETTYGRNSEPQNTESAGGGNDEVWNRYAQSFFKNNKDRIPYFDIRYSLFQSFFFDLTGRFSGRRPRYTVNAVVTWSIERGTFSAFNSWHWLYHRFLNLMISS